MLSNSYMKEDHRSYRRNFCSCEKTVRHSSPSFKMATKGSLNPMVLCANYIIFSLESSAPTFCWPDIYFTVAFSLYHPEIFNVLISDEYE